MDSKHSVAESRPNDDEVKTSESDLRFDLPPLPVRSQTCGHKSVASWSPRINPTNLPHVKIDDSLHQLMVPSLTCISPSQETIDALKEPSERSDESNTTKGTDILISNEFLQNESPTLQRSQSNHRDNSRPCGGKSSAGVSTLLSDIIGHAPVKLRIEELLLPLSLPEELIQNVLTGSRAIPSTILLYGPPGCGKTKLAEAIAGEAQAALISVAPSDVLSKFVGESEASIRTIFCNAVEAALKVPSLSAVIFFDEIDALGQSRGNTGNGEGDGCSRRVLAELLLQLNILADRKQHSFRDFKDAPRSDGDDDVSIESFAGRSVRPEPGARIIVAAATNRIADIDPALLRRFGIQLEVGLPSYKDRKKMLSRHLADILHTISDREIETLAAVTDQWSGSSLEDLARTAVMRPVHECIRSAALKRRRAKKSESYGNDASSGQIFKAKMDLIEGVQNLRPVALDDFRHAVTALTGEELCFKRSQSQPSNFKRMKCEHYDSSSSSEDEY